MNSSKAITIRQDRIKGLILRHLNAYCGAAAMHDLRLPQLTGWVEFSLPQCRNISSFIPSPFGLTLNSFHNSQFVKVTNVQSRGKVECAKKKLWQPTNKMHLIYFYDYSYDLNTRKKSDWKIIIYPSPSLNNRLKVQYSKILPVILQRGSYHDDKV